MEAVAWLIARLEMTHRHIDKSFTFVPRRTHFIFHRELSVVIKNGFLLFIRYVRKVLGKYFHSFGDWDIASVVPTDYVLALHIRNEDCRSDHVILSILLFAMISF